MKKSFMTRVLAVSLSAAMAFSMSSASNLMTASAASTVNLKTTFKTLKVNQTYKLTLKNNTLSWKITKVTTSNKKICTVYGKTASSVMLKGKGVGRAKISVKVKTTKRKYPKNIKIMKCTANVKAADDQSTAAFSASAAANSNTEVRVTFTQAIDTPEASNFTISDNVTVSKAELSEDKKSVVLTIGGAEYGKSYDLTVSGIKVGGKEQAEQKLTFITPAAEEKYPLSLKANDTILKSDGQSQTLVTFTISDANGNPITDKGVEVAFVASLGKFAEQRVSIQDGKATVMYTSETLKETQTAKITATVVESTNNKELLGLTTTTSVTLSPNPDDTSVGAIITSATAPTADRIIAYFNQPVKAENFMKNGRLDTSKFGCEVKSGLDNGWTFVNGTTQSHSVVGILDVDTSEGNALELLLDKPMTDNTNVSVKFTNRAATSSLVLPENEVYFKLTDARQPGVMSAAGDGMRKITIDFSEAVLPMALAGDRNTTNGAARFAADNIENYLIDGRPLSWWGVSATPDTLDSDSEDPNANNVKKISEKDATPTNNKTVEEDDGRIKVGSYKEGKDTRHQVTITVGRKHYLTPGTHSISISNVGDWAAKTDRERNIVNTETFNFEVASNDVAPEFTVTPQSPEQYLVKFNSDVEPVDTVNDTITTPNSKDVASLFKLEQQNGGSWSEICDSEGAGRNPIRVSKVKNDDNEYIVEVTKDWTQVYDTQNTKANYQNANLSLHIAANTIVNLANNKQNVDLRVPLTGDVMKTADVTSPTIDKIEQAVDNSGNLLDSYNVTLSEPVKLSDGADGQSGANKEGLTPSQTQAASSSDNDGRSGVPAPSAQFISAGDGETIEGIITQDAFIDAYDTTINVEPESPLSAGTWRLVISSISDDYGRTTATATETIEVTRETVTSDFKVVWAAVSSTLEYKETNFNTNGRYIFVKFNKPVTMTGNSTNAGVTANYTINGSTLPTGTQIKAGIVDYDTFGNGAHQTDSITIILPDGNYNTGWSQNYNVSGQNMMLNISKAITSTSGATLANGGMIRLPFQFGADNSSSLSADNRTVYISSLTAATDAVWGNHPDEALKGAYTGNGAGTLEEKEYYQKLKAALDDEKYRKVILSGNVDLTSSDTKITSVFGKSNTLTINRAVDIDLNNCTITGNVVVSTTDVVNAMYIRSVAGTGHIVGYANNRKNVPALKVTAPNIAEFVVENVEVRSPAEGYAVNINDVWESSFVNNGDLYGDILVTDANKAGFNAGTGSLSSGKILVDTAGELLMEGEFTAPDYPANTNFVVEVTKAATLKFDKGSVFKGLINVGVNAKNARVIADKAADVRDAELHAYTEVRVTLPKNAGMQCIKEVGGSFKPVTANNKDLSATTSTDEAVDVNDAAKYPYGAATDSGEKQVLDKLDVCTGTVNAAAPTTITWGAISKTGIDVTAAKRNMTNIVYTPDGETESKNYEVEATYTMVSTSVAEKKTVVSGNTSTEIIIGKENPTDGGKDRVRVVLKCREKGTNAAWQEVTKYLDITYNK